TDRPGPSRHPDGVPEAPPAPASPAALVEDRARPSLRGAAIAGHDARGTELAVQEGLRVVQVEQRVVEGILGERAGAADEGRNHEHRVGPLLEVAEALADRADLGGGRVQDAVSVRTIDP